MNLEKPYSDEVKFYKENLATPGGGGPIWYFMGRLYIGQYEAEFVQKIDNRFTIFLARYADDNECYYVIDHQDEDTLLIPDIDHSVSIKMTLNRVIKEEKAVPETEKNIPRSISIKGGALLNRLQNFYKLIYENCDEPDLKDLMVITLTKISFCNHLLYGDKYDMFHFKAAIEMVNLKYGTTYTVNDFFVKL